MRTVGSRLAVVALVACGAGAFAAGCASGPPGRGVAGLFEGGWTEVRAAPQPALRDGVLLVEWTRGRGADRERLHTLRTGGRDVAPRAADELLPYVRSLRDAEAAKTYPDLVRRLDLRDLALGGTVLAPDAGRTGPGSGGVYTRDDAAGWGVEFDPLGAPYAGGTRVTSVVLVPPVRNADLGYATPWRVVRADEVVLPDGTVRSLDERTLTNGSDAARYSPD